MARRKIVPKYYAVRRGRKPGVYRTWEECEAQIHKFKGARYKSFTTKEEAENFVNAKHDPFPRKITWKEARKKTFVTERRVGLDEPLYNGTEPPW